jgi:hypothetical protein
MLSDTVRILTARTWDIQRLNAVDAAALVATGVEDGTRVAAVHSGWPVTLPSEIPGDTSNASVGVVIGGCGSIRVHCGLNGVLYWETALLSDGAVCSSGA